MFHLSDKIFQKIFSCTANTPITSNLHQWKDVSQKIVTEIDEENKQTEFLEVTMRCEKCGQSITTHFLHKI